MSVQLRAQLLWEPDKTPSLAALVQHLESTGIPAAYVGRAAFSRRKLTTHALESCNPRTHVVRLIRAVAPAYELQVSLFDLGNAVFVTRADKVDPEHVTLCAESMETLALTTNVEFAYIQRDDAEPPLLSDVYLTKGPRRCGATTVLGPRLVKALGRGSAAEGVRRVAALAPKHVVSHPPALLLHIDGPLGLSRFESLGLFGMVDAHGGSVAAREWARLRPPEL